MHKKEKVIYTSLGGTALATTGLAVAQFALGGWVLLIAGLAVLTILPRLRKKENKH